MKKFKNIYIEITNICNLECSFCAKTSRAMRSMTALDFSHVLEKVAHSTEYIYLHVVGEPLLNKEIDKILTCCDEKSAKIKLTTNGTRLLNAINFLTAHPSLRAVNISLSCMKDFDKATAISYLDEVVYSATILSKEGITTTLRTWIHTNHTDIIVAKIKNAFNVDISLSQNGTIKLADRLLFDVDSEFVWPALSNATPQIENACLALRKQLAILSDGTVVPCCLDSDGILNLGNIYNNSLEEILSSKRAKNILQGFQQSKAVEQLCQTCTFAKTRLINKP